VSDAEAVFVAHREEVFRYLTRVVGHAEAAKDLTQEVFLRASRSTIPVVAAERRAWIFTIARNLGLNYLRDETRAPLAAPLVDGAATPPTQERAVAVQQALATLAVLDRDVFVLREIVGLSYEEIANACGLTADAVRSRLHRARLALRQYLSASLDSQKRTGITLMKRVE
jgi:RNA polymerase sigma-70 factor (ECF subfamily)